MSKTALIYLRVSSVQQADTDYDPEGFSIPAQRDACRRKAEALDAAVTDEFIDRGESAKTGNRPGLQAMLSRLKAAPDVDYVIVHKVDRLARNRADDVAIAMQVRAAGAQLVSATENIDETPSGLLLHGIMSSIAEFYSRNLGTEILKGTTQKAKSGGTLARAPLGYLNVREIIDGREIRTVALDPERAPLVRLAFELYARGNYSLRELAQIMEDRGLRSRPTAKAPAKPLGNNRLQALLRNDYYIGVVRYRGKVYPGRHEPLIPVSLFERVQAMLDTKRQSGERERVHHHYLKGTLYCDQCGGRLTFSRNRGNGGAYDYFVCAGRQIGSCSQPYHRVDRLEDLVVRVYGTLELSDERIARIREVMQARIAGLTQLSQDEIARARRTLARLLDEERKLLRKHYDDRISEELFEEEQARIRRERATAQETIDQLSADHASTLATLDVALKLAGDVQAGYAQAGPTVRRLLNQAFFEQLRVREDELMEPVLAQPFRQLLAEDLVEQLEIADRVWAGLSSSSSSARGSGNERTPDLVLVGGSISDRMVELAGLEPATSWVRCNGQLTPLGGGSPGVYGGSAASPLPLRRRDQGRSVPIRADTGTGRAPGLPARQDLRGETTLLADVIGPHPRRTPLADDKFDAYAPHERSRACNRVRP
jgi:site-specific DNA recombinase